MKTSTIIFLITYISISSCTDSRSTTNNKSENNPESTISTDSAHQVAEYIVEVFEDSKGRLWFGTMAKGAAMYSGDSLTYFAKLNGLCDNTVASITEDQNGNIWFGTHNGACRYDGESFSHFSESEGLHGMGCNIFVDNNGNIWACTNHGVFRFYDSKFTEFELPKPIIKELYYKWEAGKIWDVTQDSKGNMWFATDGYGICIYDGDNFTHLTTHDGLNSNIVSSITEDDNGNFWFGCLSSDFPEYVNSGGVSRFDGSIIETFPDVKGLSENDIYTIRKDKSGNIWIGALGTGIYRYNGKSFTLFNSFDRPDLVSGFALQSFAQDKNGEIWFGFSGGLFRFNGKSFYNVTQNGPWN